MARIAPPKWRVVASVAAFPLPRPSVPGEAAPSFLNCFDERADRRSRLVAGPLQRQLLLHSRGELHQRDVEAAGGGSNRRVVSHSPGPDKRRGTDDALLSSRVLPWESSSFRLPADSGRFVPTTGARHRSAPLPVSDARPRGRASDARGMVHAARGLCDTPFSSYQFEYFSRSSPLCQSASGSEKEPRPASACHTPVRTHTSSTMMSNPISEITSDPAHSEEEQKEEEEYVGMTKEEMQARRTRRTPCL